MPLPRFMVLGGEAVAAAVIVLEAVAAFGLVWERRRGGAGWWAALRSVDRLVPARVRRIMAFDLKGLVSVGLLLVRRRHGVPPGAGGLAYAGGQLTFQLAFLFVMVLEAAVAKLFSSVRVARNFNESGRVKVEGERLSVAISAQTNVVVELSERADRRGPSAGWTGLRADDPFLRR